MQISLMDNLPSNRIGFKLLLRRGKDIINFIKMQVFFKLFWVSGNLVGISINLCKSIQKELFINDTP